MSRPSWILGVNHTVHESSACLLRDGEEVVFATAEERLSRVKQDSSFPRRAIVAALEAGGIEPEQLSSVAFSFPRAHVTFLHDVGAVLSGRVPRRRWWAMSPVDFVLGPNSSRRGRQGITELLGPALAARTRFFGHHLSHAWSAAIMAPTDCEAVLVADGRGARNSTTIWSRRDGALTCVDAKRYPDSLGIFYARITQLLGFTPLSDEWKVMGLAAYGEPGVSMEPFIRVDDDDYEVNARRLLGGGFHDLRGLEETLGPARRPDDPIDDRHRAIAFAAQEATERAMLAMTRRAVRLTRARSLALAGGVAMNVKANGLLLRSGLVDALAIQPAASDEGSSVGAAVAAHVDGGGRAPGQAMVRADLGQEVGDGELEETLAAYKLPFTITGDRAGAAAERLAGGRIVGWFQGRAEFGPRALGHRSILADPRHEGVRDRVNEAVKFREPWRPFAPSVLEERARDWFEGCSRSPHMILSFPVAPAIARRIPAVVHVDGTARVHTVSRTVDPLYWQLIRRFGDLTGIPVVLNTSFNLKGDAIVNTVKDALETFYTSGLDSLVIGRCVVDKQSPPADAGGRDGAA